MAELVTIITAMPGQRITLEPVATDGAGYWRQLVRLQLHTRPPGALPGVVMTRTAVLAPSELRALGLAALGLADALEAPPPAPPQDPLPFGLQLVLGLAALEQLTTAADTIDPPKEPT